MKSINDSNHNISLRRDYMNHLMTTFFPSFCILIVAQTTVYFKTEHFKTSVPVAVSALLGNFFYDFSFLTVMLSYVHSVHLCNKFDTNNILHEGGRMVALVSHCGAFHPLHRPLLE